MHICSSDSNFADEDELAEGENDVDQDNTEDDGDKNATGEDEEDNVEGDYEEEDEYALSSLVEKSSDPRRRGGRRGGGRGGRRGGGRGGRRGGRSGGPRGGRRVPGRPFCPLICRLRCWLPRCRRCCRFRKAP